MKIRHRTVDSVLDDLNKIERCIAERAAEIFRERGQALGHALEDWLKAERETVWRPAIEVRRTKDAFVVEAAVAGVEPKQFDVRVTATTLLLGADLHHSDRSQNEDVVLCEFVTGPLFRSFTFPEPIDPARVSAEYRNGLLRVSAPLAHPAVKVSVQAALRSSSRSGVAGATGPAVNVGFPSNVGLPAFHLNGSSAYGQQLGHRMSDASDQDTRPRRRRALARFVC